MAAHRPARRPAPPRRRGWWPPARPPGASALAGWALLPLRAFIGGTFLYAGLQKLANPTFWNASNPAGMRAQLVASARISPLHALLGHLVSLSTPIGILIALAEVAIGLGTLLGLWTRIAAAGGLLLSLTLFLTVSYHSSPYYTGADIVFVFAWLPLIIAGAGGVLSLDAVIAAHTRDTGLGGPPPVVPVPFDVVQRVCGNYQDGRCAARAMHACRPEGCPFLLAQRTPVAPARGAIDRRQAMTRTAAVGLLGAGAAVGLSRAIGGAKLPASAATGPSLGPSAPTTTASKSTTPTTAGPKTPTTTHSVPPGKPIGEASRVPVGGAVNFTDPKSGDPAIVLRRSQGTFVAFDAVCPHAGCTVGFFRQANLIVCPCHGSEFNPDNGGLVRGPAPHGLTTIPVAVSSGGVLYVDG